MRATFHFGPFSPFPVKYKSVIRVFVGNVASAGRNPETGKIKLNHTVDSFSYKYFVRYKKMKTKRSIESERQVCLSGACCSK